MDLEMYQINGVQKIFYVYEKSGNLEIGHADTGGAFANSNNDWLTADVSGSFTNTLVNDAFMRVADNGFAYIFQDNNIHKIDGNTSGGAAGTVTANVVQFPPYFQITDAVDNQGRIYAAVRQDKSPSSITITLSSAPIGVYIWDRRTTVINMQNYIAIPGIREIKKIYVSPQGTIRAITINSETIVEIRELQGYSFNVIKTIGRRAYPSYNDSVNVHGLFTTWVSVDGIVYSHGRLSENDPESIYKIGSLSGTSHGLSFVGNVGTSPFKFALHVSDILSGTYRFYKWSPNAKEDGTGLANAGNVYSLVKYLPQMSNINYIDIYCNPKGSGSGTIATVKPYFNQSATAWASKAVTLDETGRGYVRIEVNKPYVNAVQLEIEFSTTVNLSGLTDFAPSFAIVDYSVTNTKG